MRLKPEGGVTDVSLHNARELIEQYGLPDIVQLVNESTDTSGHVVHAEWNSITDTTETVEHKFDGFAWGYAGQGPRGLVEFFHMIGLDRRILPEIIGYLPSTQRGLILSVARNQWSVEFASPEAVKSASVSLDKIEGPIDL